MSEIEKIARTRHSEAFRKLNPEFFRIDPNSPINVPGLFKAYSDKVKASKRPITQNKNKLKGSSALSDKFLSLWEILQGPMLEKEFKFHPERKWRSDFCHIASKTIIEIEGGLFTRGGHSSISGILRDIEKYNELSFLGYRLFRLHGKEGVAGSIDVTNITRIIRSIESKLRVPNAPGS